MRHPWISGPSVLLLAALVTGCAARFSPDVVRDEIVRQRGVDPVSQFELDLGRLTTTLLRRALSTDRESGPFPGLRQVQVSLYEVPASDGPALDVTQFDIRGWEPMIRAKDPDRSIMILIQGDVIETDEGDVGEVDDLVLIGAGERLVVYGRLRGTLQPGVPARLQDMFTEGGPQRVADMLSSLNE